jgi:hypothetical protein
MAEFATENPRGGEFFKFDQSLMERLASLGLPMSQLTIQRRMRPAVSNLIRYVTYSSMAALTQEAFRRCLYPKLEDHDCVKEYPSVRGMAKDTWFLHHTNKEAGGGDDAVSKCNPFEVLFTHLPSVYSFALYSTGGNGEKSRSIFPSVSPNLMAAGQLLIVLQSRDI